jgi:hypothetical protein
MNTRLLVPAILGAVMLSTPVLAGSIPYDQSYYWARPDKTPPQGIAARDTQCKALQAQFDKAMETQWTAAKAANARAMRTKGANLCAAGNWDQGIVKMKMALKDLGVKPKA